MFLALQVKHAESHSLENRMESFFLAETVKYLYLLFDEENFVHHDNGTAKIIETPHGACALSSGNFIFNTEAHPFDLAGMQCCSADKKSADVFAAGTQRGVDLPFLFGLTKDSEQLRTLTDFYESAENMENMEEPAPAPPKAEVIGNRTRVDYCNCDVPLSDYERVCVVNNAAHWIALMDKCPAVFCPERREVPVVPVFSADDYGEISLGSPEMLSCAVSVEPELIGYGEINLKS